MKRERGEKTGKRNKRNKRGRSAKAKKQKNINKTSQRQHYLYHFRSMTFRNTISEGALRTLRQPALQVLAGSRGYLVWRITRFVGRLNRREVLEIILSAGLVEIFDSPPGSA